MRPSTVTLSHCGIYVFDLERMERFYTGALGFEVTDRTPDLVFMSRSPEDHHQLLIARGRTAPLATLALNQIAFRAHSLKDLKEIKAGLDKEKDVTDIRPTDHGTAWALYFRDPEGNRIEFFVDTPWYVLQPRVKPFDIDSSEEEIRATTEADIRKSPSFRPIEEWRAEFEAKLAQKRTKQNA